MMRSLPRLLAFAALVSAPALHAQEKDTPWAAFVGCWEPAGDAIHGAPSITCIIPTAENDFEAQVITIAGSDIVRSVALLANGTRVALDDSRCTGWEVASFSADGARLYLSGETQCGEAPAIRTSSLYALLPSGTRLVVSGARSEGAGEQLQAQRFRLVPAQNLSGPLVPGLEAMLTATAQARSAAARPVRVEDVIEASARVHPSVTEAWLAEVAIDSPKSTTELSTRDLRALAAAQVPIEVIDMLVAVAHPTHFRIAISSVGEVSSDPVGREDNLGTGWTQAGWANRTMPRGLTSSDCAALFYRAAFGAFAGQASLIGQNGRMSECYGASAFGRFGPFGVFPFGGFGFGGFLYAGFLANGYGLDTWGAWNGWNRIGQTNQYRGYFSEDRAQPIRVTVDKVNTGGGRANNGRVVNGGGYTSGEGPSGSRAQPRGSTSEATRSTRSTESGASAPRMSTGSTPSSSGGGSSTSSHGEPTGRTAKPRVL
jgi:hypothetical protein